MPDIPLWLKIVIALALAAAAVAGYKYWEDEVGDTREEIVTTRLNKQLADQKLEAAGILAVETAKVKTLEGKLALFKTNQELTDANATKTITGLQRDLRTARGPAGRVFDPNQVRCGRGSDDTQGTAVAGSNGSPADRAETGGLLSVQLTNLLDGKLFEADAINVAYASCRSTLINDRKVLN